MAAKKLTKAEKDRRALEEAVLPVVADYTSQVLEPALASTFEVIDKKFEHANEWSAEIKQGVSDLVQRVGQLSKLVLVQRNLIDATAAALRDEARARSNLQSRIAQDRHSRIIEHIGTLYKRSEPWYVKTWNYIKGAFE